MVNVEFETSKLEFFQHHWKTWEVYEVESVGFSTPCFRMKILLSRD